MTIVSLPLASLIEEFALYPRQKVDSSHVSYFANAVRAGAKLPPIVADKASKRIVDGWHRSRALRTVLGVDATVKVDLRDYASEQEMFEDAVRLNAKHGRKLDRTDHIRIIWMGEVFGLSDSKIAALLQEPEKEIETLRIRIANAPEEGNGTIPGTIRVALKPLAAHLAGQELTQGQVAANRSAPGTPFLLVLHQVRDIVREHLADLDNPQIIVALRELHEVLSFALLERTQ